MHHAHIDHMAAWWQEYHVQHSGLTMTHVESAFEAVAQLDTWSVSTAGWFGEFDSEAGCVKVPAGAPAACISYGQAARSPSLISETATLVDRLPAQCQSAVKNLSTGRYTPNTISRSFPLTCRVDADAVKQACRLFVHDNATSPDAGKHLRQCEKVADAVSAAMGREGYVKPANKAGAALCFSCAMVHGDDAAMLGGTW
eukprot:UN2988